MLPFDPVRHDEPEIDPTFPPTMDDLVITSGGEPVNGIIYVANGPGPHPTAILLHGYPGNERNLDLAQAVRRAGWNVLFLHYRGAWGSGGSFSMMNALADVHAAIDALLDAETQAQFRIDGSQLALIGHSMGGYLAMMAGCRRAEIGRICSIAGVHLRAMHAQFAKYSALAAELAANLDNTHALKGHDFAGNLQVMSQDWATYDFLWNSAEYAHKSVLLLAASRDTVLPTHIHHQPVVDALTSAEHVTVTQHVLDTDHAFSGKRIALAHHIISWLQ